MADYTRQHYVPQFYLKHFCSKSDKTIFCYDKVEDKSYRANIRDIAQENLFYAVNETERTGIEKALGGVEQRYMKAYFELLKLKSFRKLSFQLKKDFFLLMAVQMMRTNETRLTMKDMHEQALIALGESHGMKFPKGIRFRISEEQTKANHLLMLLDTGVFFELAKFLFYKKWVILVNETDIPLWASDNPISFYNSFDYEGNVGILSPGVEIRFPLSMNLLLFSYDSKTYAPANNRDKLPKNLVMVANELQIKSSARFIYSLANNFEIARNYLEKYPRYRNRWTRLEAVGKLYQLVIK